MNAVIKSESNLELQEIMQLSDVERFCRKVQFTESDCIEWTAALDKKGYGVFRLGKRMQFAHRISFHIFKFSIPDALNVLHRCDNPRCVNPRHLFLGTQQDNMRDKKAKGRNPSGEKHHKSKLSLEQAHEIRRLSNLGMCQSVIARQFAVSQPLVSLIVNRKRLTV